MNNDLKPGAEPINGYTLIDRLGKGGFGEVWKATGPGGFQVALKFVALEGRMGTAELRALEVIKSIRHPHLLANFGSWQKDGRLIIAMELADKTLSDRLNECVDQGLPGIPAPEIFEYFLEAAKGLDFLNEPRHPTGEGGTQGIQHRDIKPQNLLLVGGSVKVADFGLARMLEHSTTGHTGSMTPSYAPPEFFQEKTTAQSDQYSLAVSYCQLRGGRLPFEGNPAAVIAGHLYREPDLSMLPEVERGAVARALAKPSRERWPSCRAFVQAVMAAEGVEVPETVIPADTSWKRTTFRDTPSGGPHAKPDPISELAHDEPRTPKWSVQVLGVWALVAAVLLVAAILLFARNRPEVAVASKTPGSESPDTKTLGTTERPGEEVTKAAPAITTRTPAAELTKPSVPLSLSEKPQGTPSSSASASAFVPLFNGKNLSGWSILGNLNHTWKVTEGGVLEGSGPPVASRLVTERSNFSNFHLRVETKIAEGPNSGIEFCITDDIEESAKYMARIAGTNQGTNQGEEETGCLSIFDRGSPPITLAKADPVIPIKPGEWFTEEVIADGNVITVIVKGVVVAKFKLFSRKSTSGAIGLLCRGNSKVAFRRVEIKKLIGPGAAGSAESGIELGTPQQPLDSGRVARFSGGAAWQIEGDELVQTKDIKLAGFSFGNPTWTDYSFSADVKVVHDSPGVSLIFRQDRRGQYFFGAGTGGSSICRWLDSQFNVLADRKSRDAQLTNGRWQAMRIEARREKFTAYLNGQLVCSASDPSMIRGDVGFRVEGQCRFRNIRVTATNGKILWEGLPGLPTASLYGVPLKGGN